MAQPKQLAIVPVMQNITLGILGGGQLGRMSALAAARLGISAIIFTPEDHSPASKVSSQTIIADYGDKKALQDFVNACDFISYEFENIPIDTIKTLKSMGAKVAPDENLLEIAQDRLKEKAFLNKIGIPTARWAKLENQDQLNATLKKWGVNQAIIKTARLGYDGKGQFKYNSNDNLDVSVINNIAHSHDYIIEDIVPFEYEISTITARDINKKIVSYGPMLNEHKNHILDKTHHPAPINDTVKQNALSLSESLAKEINLLGLLTLELFVTQDGQILANEIAPRTHNSGHWTIDACTCCQFENHVRATCHMPVAAPGAHTQATMINLIGDDVTKIDDYLKQENTCVHLYSKDEVKAGRKMGHVTILNTNKG